MDDPYRLQRFVDAQNAVYAEVLAELRGGRKMSHWMWFVFPQIAGLGHSETSRFYAITSLAEARAYLAHPLLGPRLAECTGLVNRIEASTASQIFGGIDALKFRSSMTLFAAASPGPSVFRDALERYFAGECDPETMDRL